MSSLGGYVSKIFNLQGAASTLVCGNGGGLQAIIHAWELLRSNPTQQAVVVVLADELSPMFFRMFDETGSLACGTDVSRGLVYGNGLGGVVMGEGAAAFVLEKRDSGRCRWRHCSFRQRYDIRFRAGCGSTNERSLASRFYSPGDD